MSEFKLHSIAPKVQYVLVPLQIITQEEPQIYKHYLDHSYCVNPNRLSKEWDDYEKLSPQNNKNNTDSVTADHEQNNIIKEEIIIPDDVQENMNCTISDDTACNQTTKDKRVFARQRTRKRFLPSILNARINNSEGNVNRLVKPNSTFSSPVDNHMIKIVNTKSYIQTQSVLKSSVTSASVQIPELGALHPETTVQTDNTKRDNSTIHLLSTNEKQIVINNSNFIEIKKEVAEVDIENQITHREKRFYHAICLICQKFKNPEDTSSRCKGCLNLFQYECLRCRDILSSKEEYYNHLKVKEFCLEIKVPAFLKNDSYALAARLERSQCLNDEWERAKQLESIVRIARITLRDGKFNRIKLCCPICDVISPIEKGRFYCVSCDSMSVYKCQTCDRHYTTYCSAIYHTENHVVKTKIYKCDDCPFKHKKKRSLVVHILENHLPKRPVRKPFQRSCPDCNLNIMSMAYWRQHAYKCRGKAYFKCTLCTEKYLDKEEITSHLVVAHQMTDSEITELVKVIENDRNNQAEKKRLKKLNRLSMPEKIVDRKKNQSMTPYIIPYCINCKKVCKDLKLKDRNCSKCKSIVKIQCKYCREILRSYMIAYRHVKEKCEKIYAASQKAKNGRPLKTKKRRKIKKKKTKTKANSSSNNSEVRL